jgi:hypothetical protein
MLKPIPLKILKTTATVKVCNGVDRYQKPSYTEYTVNRVHLQPTNEVRKTASNTDITLRSIMFVDARISAPVLDWCSLFEDAHGKLGDIKVIVRGVEYTVAAVDELRDDTDRVHHWEISLV